MYANVLITSFLLAANCASALVIDPELLAKRDLSSDLNQIAQDATEFGDDWMDVHGAQVTAIGSAVQSIWGRAEPTLAPKPRDLSSDTQQVGADAASYGHSIASQEASNVQQLTSAIHNTFGRRSRLGGRQISVDDLNEILSTLTALGDDAVDVAESFISELPSDVQGPAASLLAEATAAVGQEFNSITAAVSADLATATASPAAAPSSVASASSSIASAPSSIVPAPSSTASASLD
ncbi:hypothetical protein OBBRIDRAFT_148406 [Obba rivulosa]|uniref:Cell wall protein n=1 Tax=Obba rivulosa TaxID=1052685 RepID=A0A8E2AMR8_9APHY|nr:hypothetical protein OBBRIDRAFT_148406 [Obba rivulosa]